MSRIPQVAIATIVAMTGLYLTSTPSKAMPVGTFAGMNRPDTSVEPVHYRAYRPHYVDHYAYRRYYGYGYNYGYGWRRPVLGLGLGLGGLYIGL